MRPHIRNEFIDICNKKAWAHYEKNEMKQFNYWLNKAADYEITQMEEELKHERSKK